jgi:predicted patatin/cPLA2 family phospholipase
VSTIYDKWFKELKNSLEKLIEKEKKYFAISDEIKSLSLFSPTREVLFEKIIN